VYIYIYAVQSSLWSISVVLYNIACCFCSIEVSLHIVYVDFMSFC
jgi:hypothetical protein